MLIAPTTQSKRGERAHAHTGSEHGKNSGHVTKQGKRNGKLRKRSTSAVRKSNALKANIDRRRRGGASKTISGISNNADETKKPVGARIVCNLQLDRHFLTMGENTNIAWTERTWNPWRGCTKVDPGCKGCYMFAAQRRYGLDPSVVVRTKTWGDPRKWQRAAQAGGRIERVFTCSWSDWFHKDADGWRAEAWRLVKNCPNLHFQILTKRADRIAELLPSDWSGGYPNVWLGGSISEEKGLWRADELRKIPPGALRFL